MKDKVFNIIQRLNAAYNGLKEPKRFYVFLFTIGLPLIFTLALSKGLGMVLVIVLFITRGGFLAGWFNREESKTPSHSENI
ncbi:hypothetical protein LCGC14_1682030 [marine sediment metagenome]|uniref:Uncharacterized protein n=1 Tax=marine sediment metagenome TaxID=412755 RepID=A0A0F9KNB0_9ZZZZ